MARNVMKHKIHKCRMKFFFRVPTFVEGGQAGFRTKSQVCPKKYYLLPFLCYKNDQQTQQMQQTQRICVSQVSPPPNI